jgi:8-oxo-dGTP pyrophosphatase MutT (NUDIX family)
MQSEPNPENLREITREIVSGLIFSADGKLLMGHKDLSKGGVYTQTEDGQPIWHIPGGGVDEGEDNISTLKREVEEETHINIEDSKIELIDNKGKGATQKTLKETGEKVWCNMNFNVYSVKLNQNASDVKLEPTDDLVELRWFDLSELKSIPITPPSVELFKRLRYIQ